MFEKIKHKDYDIYIFNELKSTNDYAKTLKEHEAVIWAKSQVNGKGRLGRTWNNHPGKALTFSIKITPDIKTYNAPMITLVAALAVRKAIGREACIKWPNDIIIRNKKVCGILTEMCTDSDGNTSIIIGIGINANIDEFDEDIKAKATSIKLEYGEVDICDLLCKVLDSYREYYETFAQTEDMSLLTNEYNKYLINRHKTVRVIGKEEMIGECEGINNTGELIVRKNDGNICYVRSGEVSVRGLDGYV